MTLTTIMADNNNSRNSAMSAEVSKKSFEHKVSKKVAELIQVVHMLFVKNHERELELESTKTAYEQEIDSVIRDARNRLKQLQQTLDDERRRSELRIKKIELEYSNKDKQFQEKYNEACYKLKESDRYVTALKKENSDLNEKLNQIQTEYGTEQGQGRIEKQSGENEFQSNHSQEMSESQPRNLATELTDCRTELERRTAELRKLHERDEYLAQQLEHQKVNYEKLIDELRLDLSQAEIDLKKDAENLQHQLTEMTKGKEKLEQKNRNLEMHLKQMKKETERRSVHDQIKQVTDSPTNQVPSPQSSQVPMTSHGSFSDPREELERLKREIRWYRMELSNREGNFNRMFTDSAPVRIGHTGRVGSLAVTRNKTELSIGRKQQVHSMSHDGRLRHRVGHHDRLPALSMDFRQRASTRMETTDHL